MYRMRMSALTALVLALAACAPTPRTTDAGRYVELTLLGFNDFHGALEQPRGGPGGAAYLAAHLRQERSRSVHTVTVSAGDLIGATPLIASLFHDEPVIEVADLIGLEFHAVGNHEFDDGKNELLRMQHGGPRPDGRGDFAGARFRFLAANVVVEATGETLFPAWAVRRYGGVPVGFIGLTLAGTPALVTASGVAGLRFLDEVHAINQAVQELRGQGVEAIVVLIHEGGYPAEGGEDDCNDFKGAIVDIVAGTDPAVDLFVTGHTHRHYLCRLDGRPVTSAGSTGRWYTRIDARLERESGDLEVTGFDNVPVTADIEPAADVLALVDRYRALVEGPAGRVVGRITGDLTRETDDGGVSALGAFIADVQLAASAAAGAELALMNAGGMRGDLEFAPADGRRPGEVTYGDIFRVHPFGNHLVTMTLTGRQLHTLLEQQWIDQAALNVLMPSAGFSYAWRESAPPGARVDPSSIRLHGRPVEPDASYRVTVNSFLAGGGDGFTVLREGTERHNGIADVDALEQYLARMSPVSPPDAGRVVVQP